MKNLNHIKLLLSVLLFSVSMKALAQQDITLATYNNQQEIISNRSITLTNGFIVPSGASVTIHIASNPGINIGTKLNYNMNDIVTYTARVPGIVYLADSANSVNQVSVEVQTLDNFGRVKEIMQVKATPGFNDLVQQKQYDGAGHEAIKWLPFVQPGGHASFYNMGYTAATLSFYNGLNNTYAIAPNGYAYSSANYENSPDGRVLSTASPGEAFSADSGHTVRNVSAGGNVNIVRYSVNGNTLVKPTAAPYYYYASQISATRSEDENVPVHPEDYGDVFNLPPYQSNGSVFEYKDYMDRVIMKRQVSIRNSVTTYLSTYYVYDDRSNLRYVLPPKAKPDSSGTITQSMLDNLCYQYRYDDRQRLTAKKLPGKGWEYMVYNHQDKVVMTQDSVQRGKAPQEWTITKYDEQGRAVLTGIYQHSGSSANVNYQASMQTSVNVQGTDFETRVTTGNGYTANTFPKTWATTLGITYYDDYNLPGANPYPYSGTEVSPATRGMVTATQTNILGTTGMLWAVNYYDDYGSVVKAYKQHYKGGGTPSTTNYDEISNTYDFTGAVLTTTRSLKVSGTEQLKTLTEYTYDHRGRKINTWETINTGTRTLIAQNQYDELGNLFKKKLHSTDNGATFLQTITYSYNERGWLTRAQASAFDVNLRYNTPTRGAKPQYNGNIAEQEYTGANSGNKWFKYAYDAFNRLDTSQYSNTGTGDLSEYITYDGSGNITSLKRGALATAYTYLNTGLSNQLGSTAGGVNSTFTYDANGNVKTDTYRSITGISYNLLNLPVAVTAASSASYLYDATGSKLKSVQGTATREYINGVQYTNGTLDFVQTDEGIAVRNAGTGLYAYEYNLKDNLGNVRVTIDANAGVARVLQEDEYFAFGKDKRLYTLGTENKYLYNGKEQQEVVLTDEYDYGARFYDPVVGRWTSIDPKTQLLERVSPYIYSLNSPINFIDKDGELPIYINGRVMNDGQRANKVYWDAQLLRTIANSGIPNPGGDAHYVDGDQYNRFDPESNITTQSEGGWLVGNSPGQRQQAGYDFGKEDFKNVLAMLARDPKTGKITEKIQIYTHSRGAAYGAGYTEALLEMIKDHAEEFADAEHEIDFVYNMAPHQSGFISDPKGVDAYSQDHLLDPLSGPHMGGLKAAFTTNENGNGKPIIGPHSTSSFIKDVGAFTKAFRSSGGKTSKLLDNFAQTMRGYGIDVVVR